MLTPLERAAVSAAAQAAATEQDSLAPLFANLGAAVSASNLPPKLQAAIAQVLAQQTSLDQNLDGGDIKTAFQKSGIFLEASLAAGSVPASGVPDLKAALIVLRQTLQSALGSNSTVATPAAPAGAPQAAAPQASAASLAPSLSPNLDIQEILLPQARLVVAENLALAGTAARNPLAAALDAGPSAGATLNLLQEALQELGNPVRVAVAAKDGRGEDVTSHTNIAAAAVPRRASRQPSRLHRRRSRRMRRSRRPRIICSTTPMPPSHGRPCCRWRPCRTVSTIRRRRPT